MINAGAFSFSINPGIPRFHYHLILDRKFIESLNPGMGAFSLSLNPGQNCVLISGMRVYYFWTLQIGIGFRGKESELCFNEDRVRKPKLAHN